MHNTFIEEKVEISSREYNLLKEAYHQLKKQMALLRIFEAEENLKRGKTEAIPFREFVESI